MGWENLFRNSRMINAKFYDTHYKFMRVQKDEQVTISQESMKSIN